MNYVPNRPHFAAALLSIAIMALALHISAGLSFAQTTTATIEGVVTDSTGAVVPGVNVTVQGETNNSSVVTDGSGGYRVVALPPGRYSVVAILEPFQSQKIEALELPVNRTLTVNLRLGPVAQNETVVVRSDAPRLDTTTSSMSHVITSRQIDLMPLNGRNYLDLVLLTPGAMSSNARSELSGRDTRGAIFGERGGNATFLIDGIENNDDFRGGVFQAYTQDAIQEFEVIAAGYKAEFGRGSGGVVNVITKSGTNNMTGSGSFFLRNDSLDASNVEGDAAPELARYDGSVTIGGPVTRDRAWYFGSFEHIAERRESIFPAVIPALLVEQEDFSKHPETRNERLFGKYVRTVTPGRELHAQVSWTGLDNTNELGSARALPSSSNENRTNTLLTSVGYSTVMRQRVMVDSSVSYRDQRFGQNEKLGEGYTYQVTFPGIASAFEFGPRYGSKQTLDQRYLTARSVASVFSDRHVTRAGVEYLRTAVDGSNGPGLQYVISTTPQNFARFGAESFAIPQGTAFLNPGDEQSRMRNQGASFFLQDDWQLLPTLTVNLGARYDYDSEFNDANNISPRLGVAWSPDDRTVLRANWGKFYDRYRLGLAQAVPELGGYNGSTVVELNFPRLGADTGAVFGRAVAATGDPFAVHKQFNIPADAVISRANIQSLTGLSPDQFLVMLRQYLLQFGAVPVLDFSPSTGYLRQDLSAAFRDQVLVASPFKTPYNKTFTIGAERTLFDDMSIAGTYLRRTIHNVLGLRIPNLSPQSRITRQAASVDGSPLQRVYGPWYDGEYDAYTISMARPLAQRYQLQFSYTYARGTDNLLNPNLAIGVGAQGAGSVPTDNLNVEFDRGNSDLVTPHVVAASGSVALAAQFSISGVFRATSGTFFSAAGPLVEYDGDGVMSSRPRDTVRNQFRGPKTANLDVRLEKRFTVGRYSASGLIECFNLFNARHPKLLDNTYSANGPAATFGTILVPLSGRETQIGFRLFF